MKTSKSRGFSLIEIMIVMALIGGIFAGILYYVSQQQTKIAESKATGQVSRVASEIEYFKLTRGNYPSSLQELVSPENGVPLLDKKDIIDPWDNELKYIYPGEKNPGKFDVCSVGPAKGTECVYGNW